LAAGVKVEIPDQDSLQDLVGNCQRLGESLLDSRWESHAWADLLHGGLLARGLDEAHRQDSCRIEEIQARIAAPEAGQSLREFLRCYPDSLADRAPEVSSYAARNILDIIRHLHSGFLYSKDTPDILIERFQRDCFLILDQLLARVSLERAQPTRPDPDEPDLW
jgi:hypothetical protein